MACMEHSCTECDYYSCDNQRRSVCPLCGARVTNDFDEPVERDWGDHYEDDEPEPHFGDSSDLE